LKRRMLPLEPRIGETDEAWCRASQGTGGLALVDARGSAQGRQRSTATRHARRREGRYLLRTNLCDKDPAELWRFYIRFVEVASRNILRLSWPTVCTSRCAHGSSRSPPTSPRAVLDKFAAIQMLDVHPNYRQPHLILNRHRTHRRSENSCPQT
jgi:hypothetical protein